MSTSAVSNVSIYQQLQSYFQQRDSGVKQLGQDLESGNITAAEQDFQSIQTLGQSGPFASGNAFRNDQREQDFNAIGQALQSGDLQTAQQDFAQLESTFQSSQNSQSTESQPAVIVTLSSTGASSTSGSSSSSSSSSAATSSSSSSGGSEIVLNLGTLTPGEQINIDLASASNGSEQVTIGISGQQGQSPEQITFNLNQNSNEQIVLNLLNGTSNSSSSTQSSGLNVTA